MEVLYLKSQGLAHQEIRRLCDISKTTLTTYLKQYIEGGVDRLQQLDYQGQPSLLNQHASSLEDYFTAHPPQTIAEAQAKIQQITGIHRSPNQVSAVLKRLGMQRRKMGFVPGKSRCLFSFSVDRQRDRVGSLLPHSINDRTQD